MGKSWGMRWGFAARWPVCGTAVRTSSRRQTSRGLGRCQADSCLIIASGSRAKIGDAGSTSQLGRRCHLQHGWVVRDVSTEISTTAAPWCPARIKPPGGTKDLKAKCSESEDLISRRQTDARTSNDIVHGKETCPNVWWVSIPITPVSLHPQLPPPPSCSDSQERGLQPRGMRLNPGFLPD